MIYNVCYGLKFCPDLPTQNERFAVSIVYYTAFGQ